MKHKTTERQPAEQPVQQPHQSQPGQHWLLVTLERLLSIEALDIETALSQASDLVASAVEADKVDVFLYEATSDSLVAMGTSHTPLGQKQKAYGLDRLPLSNGGRSADVYLTRRPYISGRVDRDPGELPGIKEVLGVKSAVAVPLLVAGELRGVVQIDSIRPETFSEYDLRFMEAVSGWIGTITHRAELIEQIRREAHDEAMRSAAEELVTIIAHDLNNYLTPLLGRVMLIRRQAQKDKHERYVQDADEMAKVLGRMGKMVRDLMDVGRLEQGIFSLTTRPADLVAIARETARDLTRESRSIDVFSYNNELRAEVDPDRIRQALENLLSTAIKHSPEGMPVTITIASQHRDHGEWATIEIKDQGPGIDPAVMPRLFTRFAPGPGSTSLGLGLYLARGIAHAHGGTLIADSQPGEGATFCLSLPLAGNAWPSENPG